MCIYVAIIVMFYYYYCYFGVCGVAWLCASYQSYDGVYFSIAGFYVFILYMCAAVYNTYIRVYMSKTIMAKGRGIAFVCVCV